MVSALSGIRVLDFGRYISGPFSGMLLADMGADVIKVEKAGGDTDRRLRPFTKDGKSMYVSTFSRNKRCVTVNYRSAEGRALLKRLVETCDVIINNYRPGVMEKMGIGYEEVRELNPAVIYASISGFGQTGPYRDRAAFDGIATAMAGVMACNWGDKGPRGLGTPIADLTTGYVNALAIMIALFHRERTGQGQCIDTAMVDAVSPFLETLIPTYHLTGVSNETSKRNGGDPTCAPANTFRAKDGYFYLHAGTDPHFQKLLGLITLPDVKAALQSPVFQALQSRKERAGEVEALVGRWLETLTVSEAERVVSAAGIPCSAVNTVEQVVHSDFAASRNNVIWIDMPGLGKVPYPGNPLKLSATPPTEFRPGQEAGQSNYEVYAELLGLSRDEVDRLHKDGAI